MQVMSPLCSSFWRCGLSRFSLPDGRRGMGMKKKKFVMEQFLGRGKDQACSNSASLAFLSRMVFSIIMSLTFIRRVVAERSLSSSFMVM